MTGVVGTSSRGDSRGQKLWWLARRWWRGGLLMGKDPEGRLNMIGVNLATLVFQEALLFQALSFQGKSTPAR